MKETVLKPEFESFLIAERSFEDCVARYVVEVEKYFDYLENKITLGELIEKQPEIPKELKLANDIITGFLNYIEMYQGNTPSGVFEATMRLPEIKAKAEEYQALYNNFRDRIKISTSTSEVDKELLEKAISKVAYEFGAVDKYTLFNGLRLEMYTFEKVFYRIFEEYQRLLSEVNK